MYLPYLRFFRRSYIRASTYSRVMEKFIVPRLDHFAFKVSFKEILSNLVLCQGHRPIEKQMETVSYSSFLSTIQSLTSENLINFVRKRLDYFLVGLMNDEIRYG